MVRVKSNKQLASVIKTETCVSVVWQDGTLENNIRSTALMPVRHLLERGVRVCACFCRTTLVVTHTRAHG
jgi:hypothetical protein